MSMSAGSHVPRHQLEAAVVKIHLLEGENQRLREMVQAFISAGSNPRTPEYAAMVREVQALAGDT